jgi:hypothetical protein
LRGDTKDRPVFGSPVDADELSTVLSALTGDAAGVRADAGGIEVVAGDVRVRWVAGVAAYAHGWEVADDDAGRVLLRPGTP